MPPKKKGSGAKRTASALESVNSSSFSASYHPSQTASKHGNDDDVVLVYRKPVAARRPAHSAGDSDTQPSGGKVTKTSAQMVRSAPGRALPMTADVLEHRHESLSLQQSNPILSFWWRIAEYKQNLLFALLSLDINWEVIVALIQQSEKKIDTVVDVTIPLRTNEREKQQQIFRAFTLIQNHRIDTAIQCLQNVKQILHMEQKFSEKKSSSSSHITLKASDIQLYNSYVECAEAALPSRSGLASVRLCQHTLAVGNEKRHAEATPKNKQKGKGATKEEGELQEQEGITAATIHKLQSNVNFRIRSLARLNQLRFNYGVLLPAVRRCSTPADLCRFLFSTPASSVRDFMSPLQGSSSQHHLEKEILTKLLKTVNDDCKVDTNAWGPLATLGRLQVKEGVYVVQQLPRHRALQQLLKECELYGLPPFLRSIRNTQSNAKGAIANGGNALHQVGFTANRNTNSNKDCFFLSSDSLDQDRFRVNEVEPMILQAVEEELVTLTTQHAAFGLVVGEGDQICQLLKMDAEWVVQQYQQDELNIKGEWRNIKRDHSEDTDVLNSDFQQAEKRKKTEAAEEGNENGAKATEGESEKVSISRKRPNLMQLYVRRTMRDALRHEEQQQETEGGSGMTTGSTTPYTAVHWIGDCNRWYEDRKGSLTAGNGGAHSTASNMTNYKSSGGDTHYYYGVLFCVVLRTMNLWGDRTNEGYLPEYSIDADGELNEEVDGNSDSTAGGEIPYYISTVIEMKRD